MKALVVYDSLWGNTAAVARAIADGIGPDARAVPTDEATNAAVAEADLIVAGSPVMAFNLPSDEIRAKVADDYRTKAPTPPDVSHPSMRSWLEGLPAGHAKVAAFDTRLRWTPRGAAGSIDKALERAGYQVVAKAEKFIVQGTYGPLREGELDRARRWGKELARSAGA